MLRMNLMQLSYVMRTCCRDPPLSLLCTKVNKNDSRSTNMLRAELTANTVLQFEMQVQVA